jgi:transcriptional regulator with XRE-family HTH domain
MIIGNRLRDLREVKKFSQGEIEKRSGLLRCYISRVENGHTIPAIETLEKMARALEVPMYQLFYDGDEPPKKLSVIDRWEETDAWGATRQASRYLIQLRRALARMGPNDRAFLMDIARRLANRKRI